MLCWLWQVVQVTLLTVPVLLKVDSGLPLVLYPQVTPVLQAGWPDPPQAVIVSPFQKDEGLLARN
jgi:hypothetical protein